jgi:hypothetical protein
MKERQAGREQEAQGQQQQAAAAQGQGVFDKALITCMQGRGYLMK